MRLLGTLILAGLLGACSSMLIGEGTSSAPALGSEGRSSTQIAQDDALAAAVRNQFAAESTLQFDDVNVLADSGVVTLQGTVARFETRDRAVVIAGNTLGVVRVNNQIQVNTRQ